MSIFRSLKLKGQDSNDDSLTLVWAFALADTAPDRSAKLDTHMMTPWTLDNSRPINLGAFSSEYQFRRVRSSAADNRKDYPVENHCSRTIGELIVPYRIHLHFLSTTHHIQPRVTDRPTTEPTAAKTTTPCTPVSHSISAKTLDSTAA